MWNCFDITGIITIIAPVMYIDRYQLAVLAKYTRSALLMTTEDSFLAGFVMRYENFVNNVYLILF